MPKKRTKKTINKKLFEDITKAEPKDFCYFIDSFKKIWQGEIQKVFKEENQLLFQIMEQKESKYYIVPASRCSFSEKRIKEIKSGK